MEDDILNDQPRYSTRQAATLKELQRRANDRIRVYNPTDDDFLVRWDGVAFRVPGKDKDNGQGAGQAVQPRYIAENYTKKMIDKILGERLFAHIKMEIERRLKSGLSTAPHDDWRLGYEAQYRIDNEAARTALRPIVWLGIEEEYGLNEDIIEDKPEVVHKRSEEDILRDMDRPAVAPQPMTSVDELLNPKPVATEMLPNPGIAQAIPPLYNEPTEVTI